MRLWGVGGSAREPDGPTLAMIAFQAGLVIVAMRRQARRDVRPAPPRAPRWIAPLAETPRID
jgi:hypothetical protein